MDDKVLPLIQAIAALVSGGTLGWVVKNLLAKDGSLSPRWYADQEHGGRVDAEKRADRVLDMFDAALETEEKKRRKRGS